MAKTSTDDQNLKKLRTKLPMPQISCGRSIPNSSAESRNNSQSSRRSYKSRTINSTQLDHSNRYVPRNGVTSSSQLPATLQQPNTVVTNSPRTGALYNANRKRIATKIEAQPSNLNLTAEERDALISRILTTDLETRSKLDAQAKELFSSQKSDSMRHTPPSKHTASSRAHDRISTSDPNPLTPSERRTPAGNVNVHTNSSKPNSTVGGRTRQTKYKTGRSLTPIPESRF